MSEYQTALDIVIDRLGNISDDEELVYAIDTLQQLLYLYRHRLIDAQVLNDLRVMTNTMGDLDLKHEVRRLVNYEIENEIKKSDKEIFCATREGEENEI